MKIGGILKKGLAVSLCALMLGGTAVSLPSVVPQSGITVSAAQTYGDFMYEINNNEVTISKYKGSGENVTIPSAINGKKVTSIGDSAFENCTSLKSVTIPSSVKNIGWYAFMNCTSLTSVTIPSGVMSIGWYAFRGCDGLADKNGFIIVVNVLCDYLGNSANVVIPSSVKCIGSGAFSCKSIKSVTIPSSVTSIGDSAFEHCLSLKSITIPSSVKSIGDGAFYGCEGLADKNGFVIVKGGLYSYFGGAENVVIPSGVTSIGNSVFSNSALTLKSVTIPSSVKSIRDYAFSGCKGLKSITIPSGVTSIGGAAFYDCSGLTSITIPSSVNSIGDWAFSDCKGLKSVILSNGVTRIDEHAFFNCTGLTSITIPSSVKSIGDQAFGYYFDIIQITDKKNSDYTIYGIKGSAAEKYAKDNGFKFVVSSNTVAPTAVSLNKTSMSLGKGETTKLTATVAPSNATNKSVTWRTSDSKVLTVDKNGNVKAVGNGTAWITAKTSNGKEKSCKITVKNAPSKVTISKGVVTIGVGEKFTVGSAVPDGSAAAKRTYRTSNSSIVKMTRTDWQGDFVGVKPGTAYVTVRTYNGKESTCKVTVKAAPSSVTISKKTMTMKVGQTATLSCSVPSDAGCATRTYRTSNSSVVKMTKTSWTGTFKALKKGTAYVTVRTYNGKESSCKITVV